MRLVEQRRRTPGVAAAAPQDDTAGQILLVTDGRLDLGTWQRIFYVYFYGQRAKRIIVKVLGVAE
jgi:hypothetical protein